MAQRRGRGQPGYSQIGRYLGGVAAALVFRHAQPLLLASTEAGRCPGEHKKGEQGG